MAVTGQAGQYEIFWGGLPAMFEGDRMINLVAIDGEGLVNAAIFAGP